MFTRTITKDFQRVCAGSLTFVDFLSYWGFIVLLIDGARVYYHAASGRRVAFDASGRLALSR